MGRAGKLGAETNDRVLSSLNQASPRPPSSSHPPHSVFPVPSMKLLGCAMFWPLLDP